LLQIPFFPRRIGNNCWERFVNAVPTVGRVIDELWRPSREKGRNAPAGDRGIMRLAPCSCTKVLGWGGVGEGGGGRTSLESSSISPFSGTGSLDRDRQQQAGGIPAFVVRSRAGFTRIRGARRQ
jgi:hypothetical protein